MPICCGKLQAFPVPARFHCLLITYNRLSISASFPKDIDQPQQKVISKAGSLLIDKAVNIVAYCGELTEISTTAATKY